MRHGEEERLVDIWLEASIHSHGFVRDGFWRSKRSDMLHAYIPGAENWVLEQGGRIVAFYSLAGETLAALFVLPALHGQGIGSRLMAHAKTLRNRLDLAVYEENPRARAFYEKHGFVHVDRRRDEATGHMEHVMEFRSRKHIS